MQLRRSLAVLSLLVGCAPMNVEVAYPLAEAAPPPAPQPWSKVTLGEVKGAAARLPPADSGWNVSVAVPPAEALGGRLRTRLGAGGERPLTLRIENVRMVVRVESRMSPRPLLGMGADFVLSGGEGEKILRLEHSINQGDIADEESHALAYARLVDDLCDRLLYHPEAIAYLGGAEVPAEDSGRLAEVALSRVMPVEASAPGVAASGRLLWGRRESQLNVMGMFLQGLQEDVDLTGLLVGFAQRTSAWGGKHSGATAGFRASVAGGGLRIATEPIAGTGEGFSGTMVMTQYMLGAEVGHLGTVYDGDGYVERPGASLLLVPQISGSLSTGSLSGGPLSMVLLTNILTFGGALEADLPLGASFGLTAGVFAGLTMSYVSTSVTGEIQGFPVAVSDSFTSTAFQVAPQFDLYHQSASGRLSLGLAFREAAGAVSGSGDGGILPNTLNLTLTYEDRFGRGIAYAATKVDSSLGGSEHTAVLSTPRTALKEDGQPSAPVATP